jgi:hypothetical protein
MSRLDFISNKVMLLLFHKAGCFGIARYEAGGPEGGDENEQIVEERLS